MFSLQGPAAVLQRSNAGSVTPTINTPRFEPLKAIRNYQRDMQDPLRTLGVTDPSSAFHQVLRQDKLGKYDGRTGDSRATSRAMSRYSPSEPGISMKSARPAASVRALTPGAHLPSAPLLEVGASPTLLATC